MYPLPLTSTGGAFLQTPHKVLLNFVEINPPVFDH